MTKVLYAFAAVLVLLLLWLAATWINKKDAPLPVHEARTEIPVEPEAPLEPTPEYEPAAQPEETAVEPTPMNFDRQLATTPLCRPPELDDRQDYRFYAVVTNQRGTKSNLRLTPGDPKIKAGLIEVEVNSPDEPVVLLLNNYHSTLWNIGVTRGTEILAVLASGYENQAVAGLKPEVSVIHASSQSNARCRFEHRNRKNFQADVSKRFGRTPDVIVDKIENGTVSFGPPRNADQELISYGDLRLSKLDAFARPMEVLAEAVDRGGIRPATTRDINQWQDVRSQGGRLNIAFPPRIDTEDVFVITDPGFTIPDDLYQPGDRRAARIFSFLIPPGQPMPEGDLANVRLQFMEDGRCLGDGCEYGAVVYHTAGPPPKSQGLPPLKLPETCRFQDLNLPDSAVIYAGGAYSAGKSDGANTSTTIAVKARESQAFPGVVHPDNFPRSSSRSTIRTSVMEVEVSDPGRTVALILGCYEATVWNIRVRPDTTLAAVVLTGYHSQNIGQLPDGVPVLTGSYDDGRCWSTYFGDTGESLARINQLSVSLFGRRPDQGFRAREGRLVIDPRLRSEPEMSRMPAIMDTEHQGLLEALRRGLIRPLTPETAEAWRQRYIERLGVENLADSGTKFEYARNHNAYEILSDKFVIPDGLVGARSADFYVPEQFDVPQGETGHATIYLLKDGTCLGAHPGCRFMR